MYNSQSINERLRNFSRENNIENVERVRVILCLERVIARLMQDDYLCKKLIFGGGFVLYKEVSSQRFTTDVDAIISNIDKEELIKRIKAALKNDLSDGFWFDEIRVKKLTIESGYGGLRFKIPYKAGLPNPTNDEEKLKLRSVQLDISVGTNLEEYCKNKTLHSILDIYSELQWNIYPLEFICAEKIHCLYAKRDLNTRGKDIYDLGMLLPRIEVTDLEIALIRTFKTRNDDLRKINLIIKKINNEYLRENYLKVMQKQTKSDFEKDWRIILDVMSRIKV